MQSNRLDKKTVTGSNEAVLFNDGSDRFDLAVRWLSLVLTVTFLNDNAAEQTVSGEKFFANTKVTLQTRAGRSWIQNVQIRILEMFFGLCLTGKIPAQGYFYGTGGDTTVGAGVGITTSATRILHIPVYLPRAAKPEDFERALAHIGTMTVSVGATGNSHVTVQSYTVELSAESRKVAHTPIGTEWKLKIEQSAGGTEETIQNTGAPIVNLFMVSNDAAGKPLSGAVGPRLTLDDGPALVDQKTVAVTQLQALFPSELGIDPFATVQNIAAPILVAQKDFTVSELPYGNKVGLSFETRAAITPGDHLFLSHTLAPFKAEALANMTPGSRSFDDLARATEIIVANKNGRPADPRVQQYLPRRVYGK